LIQNLESRPPTNANFCLPQLSQYAKTLVDLLAVHTAGALQQLVRIVDSAECAPGCVDALDHQKARDDDPEGVHEDKVAPVVCGLGARVRDVEDVVVEHGGGVVEDVAVELAERDDELERVADGVVVGDEAGGDEGERAPECLRRVLVPAHSIALGAWTTYSSDRLHTQHKGVLGEVARVAQAVLLPQLAEQVLHAAHGAEVVGEVALEKGVDAAAEDEPHDGREVAVAQRRPDLLNNGEGDAQPVTNMLTSSNVFHLLAR
jgi:hypothetical protein